MRPGLVREARVASSAPSRRARRRWPSDSPRSSTRSRTPSTAGSTARRRTPAASPGHPPSSCTSPASNRSARTRPRAWRTGSCSATRTCSRPRSGTSTTWATDQPEVEALAWSRRYDLTFLTAADIPWEDDGTRNSDAQRQDMQRRFEEVLALRPEPVIEVRGSVEERTRTAIVAIERVLGLRPPQPSVLASGTSAAGSSVSGPGSE